jgi:hypothetical protein
MIAYTIFVVVMTIVLVVPGEVNAGRESEIPFCVDPKEVKLDNTPPTAPRVHLHGIRRGRGIRKKPQHRFPHSEENPYYPPDPRGSISLTLWGATDDRTEDDALGYRVYFLDGNLPDGFVPQDTILKPEPQDFAEYRITLVWNDRGTDSQEPFRFRIAVSSVDLGGNESILSRVVVVDDEGTFLKQPNYGMGHVSGGWNKGKSRIGYKHKYMDGRRGTRTKPKKVR